MTGVSGYFWGAYAKAVKFSSAAVETVQNIKKEDVAAAASRATTAALSALSAIRSCAEALTFQNQENQEGEGEIAPEGEAEGWVNLGEPGAPPGGAPLKKDQ